MAVSVGSLRVSVLLLVKGAATLALFLWLASTFARVLETRLRRLSELTPAMQVLTSKLVRFALITLAVVLALGSVGIDLTAFAVFSGAVGVGIGLGLQKVVSNLVSGVILLVDRSIKPGDVIEMEGTYGWITSLNARYVSLATRDGKELLIPNEDLITGRVTNWSYSSDLIRQSVHVGISYGVNRRPEVDPFRQSELDPCLNCLRAAHSALGWLVQVMHRRDPRARGATFASLAARRAGGSCASTWASLVTPALPPRCCQSPGL